MFIPGVDDDQIPRQPSDEPFSIPGRESHADADLPQRARGRVLAAAVRDGRPTYDRRRQAPLPRRLGNSGRQATAASQPGQRPRDFPNDGSRELRRLAMGAILAGRLKVPAPAGRWGAPAPLNQIVDAVCAHRLQAITTPSAATTDQTQTAIYHINHRVHFTYNEE
jgi:hypothetical protein